MKHIPTGDTHNRLTAYSDPFLLMLFCIHWQENLQWLGLPTGAFYCIQEAG